MNLATSSAEAATIPEPQYLFVVTLPWNPSNDDEGDYCDSRWAANEEAAVRDLAVEMSEHRDSGATTDQEREEYVAMLMETSEEAGFESFAERVSDRVLSDCRELICGPDGTIGDQQKADLDALTEILARYGAGK